MSVFEYKAIDSNGKESAGILESDSLKSARYALKSQHLTVVEVTKSKRKLSQSKSWFDVTLSMMDVSLFVRQLASLLQASMPIDEALQTIATHSDKKYIKKTIQKIRSSVMEGKSLASSLKLNAQELPPYLIATVEAGEGQGPDVLGFVATRTFRSRRRWLGRSDHVEGGLDSQRIRAIVVHMNLLLLL